MLNTLNKKNNKRFVKFLYLVCKGFSLNTLTRKKDRVYRTFKKTPCLSHFSHHFTTLKRKSGKVEKS
jgi:hypothetical protein